MVFFLLLIQLILISKTLQFEHFGGFAEVCSDKLRCNIKKSLRCGIYDTCECIENQIYIATHEGCLPEPHSTNSWQCTIDSQCHRSQLGILSYCYQKHCTCLQEINHGDSIRDVIRFGNNCYLVKDYRESCTIDAECDSLRNFKCIGSGSKQCDCDEETHWYHYDPSTDTHDCHNRNLPLPCKQDEECKEILGNLVTCDSKTKICKCWDTIGDGYEETGMVNGRCHYRRNLGSECSQDEECVMGGGSGTFCNLAQNICQQRSISSCAIALNTAALATIFILFSTIPNLHFRLLY